MRFYIQIDPDNKSESELIPYFMNELVRSVGSDIMNSLDKHDLKMKENILNDLEWVSWIKKPSRLNIYLLYRFISKSIEWESLDNGYYVVKINNNKLPGSETSIDQVARYLDFGGLKNHPNRIISNVFKKYREGSEDYFRSFMSHKLHNIKVKNKLTIR